MRPPSRPVVLPGTEVLLVDDDEDFLELFAALLSTRGARVRCVSGVPEALETLRRETFDVIVSDLEMPGPDGIALIRQVRACPDQQLAAIPAIALTARSDLLSRKLALEAGFCRRIVKPVDVAILCAEIALLTRSEERN